MNAYEKAAQLAREIKALAYTYCFGVNRSQPPSAISIERSRFAPASTTDVLAELNKNRAKRPGVTQWTMSTEDAPYPVDVTEALEEQTNVRTNVLFFRPRTKSKVKS